ncbi:MAG TPA: hypothetical protein VID75_08200, partial [Acidimicrobiales bacterium]
MPLDVEPMTVFWPSSPALRSGERQKSGPRYLDGTSIPTAQGALDVTLEVDRCVFTGEMEVSLTLTLNTIESGVLAHLEVRVSPQDVRV